MQSIFKSVRLLAFATALAMTAGGAQAQKSDAGRLCEAFALAAKEVMAARQGGVERVQMENLFVGDDFGRMDDLNKWMVDEAYSVGIADDPAAADRMIKAFKMHTQVECMTRMVAAAQ